MSKKSKWRKFRPESNEVLEELLYRERILMAEWYELMSGQVLWSDGERQSMAKEQEAIALTIDHLIGKEELRTMQPLGPG